MHWQYDESRQVGTDFDDPGEVAAYDARQGVDDRRNDAILDLLEVKRGTRFVEIGCGTGRLSIRAARRGARVTAVDVSEAMLAATRRNAGPLGAELRAARGGFLTFTPDEPADVIASCYALHHLSDFWKQAALIRLAGMLAPEGRLFLRDVVFSFPPAEYRAAIEQWISEMTEHATGWSRSAFEPHVRDEHSSYAWVMRGLIERAGFVCEETCWAPTYADYRCSLAPR